MAAHPEDSRLSRIYGTVIHEELGPGHLRNVVVFAAGEVDRSPTGSATSARCGRVLGGVITEVEGAAFPTASAASHSRDGLGTGFVLR